MHILFCLLTFWFLVFSPGGFLSFLTWEAEGGSSHTPPQLHVGHKTCRICYYVGLFIKNWINMT